MALVAKKTEILINAFLEGKELAISDISKLLDTSSRGTAYSYIEECRKTGMNICSKKAGKKVVYYCEFKDKTSIYPKMNKDDIEKFAIINYLKKNSNYDRSKAVFTVRAFDELLEDSDQNILINYKRTHFYKLIKELVEDKVIYNYYEGRNQKIYLPYNEESLYDEDYFDGSFMCDWEALYRLLRVIPQNHSYYHALKSIEEKLALVLGDIDYLEKNDLFLTYGKTFHGADNLAKEMQKLKKYSYANKMLKVKIRTAKNDEIIYLCVAFIIYSLDQDCLYIYGKQTKHPESARKDKYSYALVKVNSILQIEETNYKNIFYKNEEAKLFIKHMIGASSDKNEDDIKIIIDKNSSEYSKEMLKMLANETSGKFIVQEDTILYEGKVVGRGNIQKLLRKLGEDLIDVCDDNNFYRQYILNSTKRTLESYKEYFNEE